MKIVNDIDSGNSNIDESQTIEIASAIGELVSRYNKPKIPNKLTRLEACRHLRVSETKFNMLRRKGLISEGTKKAGDVRKWSIEELDKYIMENNVNTLVIRSNKRNMFARLFAPSIARKMIFHAKTPLFVLN